VKDDIVRAVIDQKCGWHAETQTAPNDLMR